MRRNKYFYELLETTYGEYYTTYKGRYEALQGCPYDFEEFLERLNQENQDENQYYDSFYID